jgi:serine/threonine-protein kinase
VSDEVERFKATCSDRYTVDGLIGRGGMADVYRALDVKHGRHVAVKLLRPDVGHALGVDRFVREIEIAARLQHPNILPVYDSGSADGALYYIMPFVEGGSLRGRLREETTLPVDAVMNIVQEVADALAFAHQRNVVHRDIKPENILFSSGHAVVADFGIARAIENHGGEGLTQVGLGLGTPEYMSPEQAFGEADIDGRSDTYSLACVTYELLTGKPPFTGDNATAVIMRKTATTAPQVTTRSRVAIPGGVDEVVARALTRDRMERYATVTEFARALREALTGEGPAATRSTRASRAPASIAVLPFVNTSGAPENDFLCDGISDELIHALAKVPGLRVVARTSAFAFKGSTEDARSIAGKLHVQSLLEGSLRRAGDRLRITTQLVDAATGFQIWSERFDREINDVFEVQDEITLSIVSSLRLELMPAAETGATTRNLRAYERYLEARFLWNQRTESGMRRSLDLFEEAIALDPSFAPALGAQAAALVTLGIYGQREPSAVMSSARAAADKALAINPVLAEALTARACIRAMHDWDWTGAEEDFRRAIESDGQSPTARQWFAMNLLVPLGRFDEARRHVTLAREADPLSPVVALGWGLIHYFERDFERAIDAYRQLLERSPEFGIAHFFLGQALLDARRPEDALSHLQRSIDLAGETPEAMAMLGVAHALAGREPEARAAMAALQARAATSYVSPVLVAQLHVALGETGAALDCLTGARDVRATDLVWIGVRPAFDAIRLEPRFENLARSISLLSSASP